MHSYHFIALVAGLSLVMPLTTSSQEKPGGSSTVTTKKPGADAEPPPGRWVRTLTNVQVELTITDQTGAGAPEKKTVTMVVSSGSWGRIRSAGNVRPGPDTPPTVVELNVDARPMVAVDGPIQMELTLVYRPLGSATDDTARGRPLPLNQSLTVILQSGKALVVSQAADPLNDRKIGVEVKATVLK